MKRVRVFVSSPLSGDIPGNIKKAISYCKHATEHGRAPYAPHIINTLWLNDELAHERAAGIEIGLEFLETCAEMWAYFPEKCYGKWTRGMFAERERAVSTGKPVYMFSVKEDGTISSPEIYQQTTTG